MSALISLIEKLPEADGPTDNVELYNEIFDYYTSDEVMEHYDKALRQLDKTSMDDTNNSLLFRLFHMATDRTYYHEEQQDKFCQFWLPTYEFLFEQLLPNQSDGEDLIERERLVVIKYLVTNMIEMQKTSEIQQCELQFKNFRHKNEYFTILKLILPLVSNSDLIGRLEQDNFATIILEYQSNTLENTVDITPTFAIWIILKLLIMFIRTDNDCLFMIKKDPNIKHILFTSLQHIHANDAIKLALCVAVGLIVNEHDLNSDTHKPIEMITTLMKTIQTILASSVDEANYSRYGIHIVDLIVALKAYLQQDQFKNEFLASDGLNLLDKLIHKPFQLEQLEILGFECLLTMSFNKDAANLLKANENFMTQIRNSITKTTDGLLWKLEKEEEFRQTNTETNDYDVIISYNQNDYDLVYEIYRQLTEDYQLKVWFDENPTIRVSCEMMAQAIDQTKCVLICISEAYKTSGNCRIQAEYAQDRRKEMILLIVGEVELDNWLKFISTEKMCIDFVQSDSFSRAMDMLIDEIQRNHQTDPETLISVATAVPLDSSSPGLNTYKSLPMESWSDRDVQEFLKKNKLDPMLELTEYMNGEELQVLISQCLSHGNYWSMFDRLNKEMEKRFHQTFPVSVYLRFLNQGQKYYSLTESF
ncbi:unnamed protein product [Adineta ricciae]|uniref:TIR domain-containing protein n=1 Tax=Adineta ricciae TaxID=249248 RepID=A0A815L0P9_ADIRI|nr:unnamed protein product [Adineta ricciae]CAF1400250.1 unnamed protein product [Adineta ricciae]